MVRRSSLLVLVILASGCGDSPEPVRTYTVPKPAEAGGEFRILGAIFPADEPAWFFKLAGRHDDLAPHAADFEKLVGTVRFPNGVKNAPAYDLPPGWELGGAKPEKMADETVKLPGGKGEVTVTKAGGDLGGNIARWAKQLGKPLDPAAARAAARPITGRSGTGWLVDLRGSKNPAARPPMMGGQ